MNAQDIRNKYLQFMQERKHALIPRALLVPNNDPTTLFTGSGMQPLIPYLLGERHQDGTRLVDSQTCLRAMDIEEVGDNRHTVFFEMLGNWSLGDYFKAEQLPWFWEFLTDVVGLDPQKLYVTCCSGFPEYGVPKDEESAAIWRRLFTEKGIDAKELEIGSEEAGYSIGAQDGRIFFYDEKNWWSRDGAPSKVKVGEPCGPDSEVFYLLDFVEHDKKWGEHCHPNCDCGRYIEIGNSVFMEYIRTENGFDKLPAQNVDFGGGLERIAQAAINSDDMFKISLLWPIIQHLEKLSGKQYAENTESMRVIADHLRAATFLAVDGVVPSNKEQGYVMRRLLRRAIRFAFDLGVEQNFLQEIVPVIADLYHEDFPEVAGQRQAVTDTLVREEKAFRQTLRKGDQILQKLIQAYSNGEKATFEKAGQVVFLMHDTYGYPKELTVEHLRRNGIELGDWELEFNDQMMEQRARSQTAAKGTFKGGLGGQTLQHKKYHTATHLMYQALRNVLGDHVIQRGSNITEERLRFDFSHPEKVTQEQLAEVESIVNDQISRDLKVTFAEYPTQVAREEKGALGQFGDRYGDTVKVYQMLEDGAEKPFSFEICGGPHVDHTLQLFEDGKRFKITKEEASSAGVRRIKAVLA
jgi:alanyl-tRNA synthetase